MSVRRGLRSPLVLVAAFAAAATVLSGCTATKSGHSTVSGQISFINCGQALNLAGLGIPSSRLQHLSFGCGQLAVPLNHQDAGGPTITLQLLKVHDDRNATGNSLLVNPGGPGSSGIDFAVGLAAEVSDTLLSHFDIVGFDPRGVGASDPVTCVSNAEKDVLNNAFPNVLTSAGFAQAKSLAQGVAQACSAKYGSSLADFDTVQTAEDMDRIRVGLGGQQLNYLGASYGTELGSVYAHLFPHNLRAEVLDGAVDPFTSDITQFAAQLGGFEGAFDQFAQDCLNRSDCKSLGNPRQAVYDIVAHANQSPLPSSDKSDQRRASGALVLTGVLAALYSKSEWPTLGDALIAGKHHDAKGLLALADIYDQRNSDGSYTNSFDANTTIGCNDAKPGPSDATVQATAQQWVSKYPMFGLWSAVALFSCQDWQPHRTPIPLATAPDTPQKVLVIGNLHDPATPYQGAKDLVATMGNAELLTWDGEGHTSYLQGSSCIDGYVNSYLITGTLPPANTTCPR